MKLGCLICAVLLLVPAALAQEQQSSAHPLRVAALLPLSAPDQAVRQRTSGARTGLEIAQAVLAADGKPVELEIIETYPELSGTAATKAQAAEALIAFNTFEARMRAGLRSFKQPVLSLYSENDPVEGGALSDRNLFLLEQGPPQMLGEELLLNLISREGLPKKILVLGGSGAAVETLKPALAGIDIENLDIPRSETPHLTAQRTAERAPALVLLNTLFRELPPLAAEVKNVIPAAAIYIPDLFPYGEPERSIQFFEGAYLAKTVDPNAPNTVRFRDELKKRSLVLSSVQRSAAARAFDALLLVGQAPQGARSLREELCRTGSFEGASGLTRFIEGRASKKPVRIFKVVRGEFVLAVPAKQQPGGTVCGCGEPDSDSDADGAPDCLDGCPKNSALVTAGRCGCQICEEDAETFRLPDGLRPCPVIGTCTEDSGPCLCYGYSRQCASCNCCKTLLDMH